MSKNISSNYILHAVALTDAEKAAGYKIQFVDISINYTSGTYKPFWAVSYTY